MPLPLWGGVLAGAEAGGTLLGAPEGCSPPGVASAYWSS